MHPRVESGIARIEHMIESMGGTLNATERRKVAMLIASSPDRYMHDGQVDVNLAHRHACSLPDHVWPKHSGTEYPQRGTGNSVRDDIVAAINRSRAARG